VKHTASRALYYVFGWRHRARLEKRMAERRRDGEGPRESPEKTRLDGGGT